MASWHVTRLNTTMGSLFARLCDIMSLSMQDHIYCNYKACGGLHVWNVYPFSTNLMISFLILQAHRVAASPKSAAGSEELSPDSPE